jgi:ribosomal protein L24
VAAKIKRNDEVQVLTGKDRGRRGEVRQVIGDKGRAIVTGINMVKKHRRTGPQQPGGIIERGSADRSLSNLASSALLRPARARGVPGAGGRPQGAHLQEVQRGDRLMPVAVAKIRPGSSSATATRSRRSCSRSSATTT